MIYVTGPGHGGPALVANAYLEGTYSEVYPNVSCDEEGMKRLFTQFSFPGRHSQSRRTRNARLHPRGRRTRLCAVARLWRRIRQSGPDRCLRCRRRRGRDRTAGDKLALQQVPQSRPGTAPSCRSCISMATRSPIPPCLPASATRSSTNCFAATATRRYFVEGHDPDRMHELMASTLDRVFDEIRAIKEDARRTVSRSDRAGR